MVALVGVDVAGGGPVPGSAVQDAAQTATVTKISHATATSMFRQAGITWSSSGNCSDRDNPTCTSFGQLNLATAQGAQTLKGASGRALNITGGTETGHTSGTSSHWNGYKLDYGKNTCVTTYIKGRQRGAGPAPGKPRPARPSTSRTGP